MKGHPMTSATGELIVTHVHGREIVANAGGVDIATYVYQPRMPPFESSKPYLHPLRTLNGALVSAYRPNDHRSHKGFQMTISHLSGQNFWGGNSYRHPEGYRPLDNVGRMRHDSFEVVDVTPQALALRERLTWITSSGEHWVAEHRDIRIHGVDIERGAWMLDFGTELRNIRGAELLVGSPTTAGRPNAGYTGFFWRGPRGWTGGQIITADGGGPQAMGQESPWLAYTGQHDEVDGGGTLLVFAGSSTAPVPLKWFVRNDPFPGVNPSPAFDEEIVLGPDESFRLAHRAVFADRAWDRPEIEAFAAEHAI
jgi:methane monooxygenase PmoA-like